MRRRSIGLTVAVAALAAVPGAQAAKWKVHKDVSRGPAVAPQVAVDRTGATTVAFQRVAVRDGRQDTSTSRVFAAHAAPGRKFAQPYQVAGAPSEVRELVTTADGVAVMLVFVGSSGCYGDRLCPGTYRVTTRRPGGRFGSTRTLTTNGHSGQLAVDGDGRPTVTWLEGAALANRSLRVAELAARGWRERQVARGEFHRPEIAVGERGDAVLTWMARQQRIRASFRRAGGSFGSVTTLEPHGFVNDPVAAVDAKGNALVAFTGVASNGGPQSVFAVERRVGRNFGSPRNLHENSSGPRIVMTPGGTAAVEFLYLGAFPSQEMRYASRSARGKWSAARTVAGPNEFVRLDFGRTLMAALRGASDTTIRAFVQRTSGKWVEEAQLAGESNLPHAFDAGPRGHAATAWFGQTPDAPVSVALRTP
jgi:hypothetical protein